MIGGVCGGLAQYFGLDSSALRVISALLILFGGMSVWVYLILWLVIPDK
jgi:phage shock protein PspC (stress-responsive transcriptional regulator)